MQRALEKVTSAAGQASSEFREVVSWYEATRKGDLIGQYGNTSIASKEGFPFGDAWYSELFLPRHLALVVGVALGGSRAACPCSSNIGSLLLTLIPCRFRPALVVPILSFPATKRLRPQLSKTPPNSLPLETMSSTKSQHVEDHIAQLTLCEAPPVSYPPEFLHKALGDSISPYVLQTT